MEKRKNAIFSMTTNFLSIFTSKYGSVSQVKYKTIAKRLRKLDFGHESILLDFAERNSQIYIKYILIQYLSFFCEMLQTFFDFLFSVPFFIHNMF